MIERLRRPVQSGPGPAVPGEGQASRSTGAARRSPRSARTRTGRRRGTWWPTAWRPPRGEAWPACARCSNGLSRRRRPGHRRAGHRQVGVRGRSCRRPRGTWCAAGSAGLFGGAAAYNAVRRLAADVAGVGGGRPDEAGGGAARPLVAHRLSRPGCRCSRCSPSCSTPPCRTPQRLVTWTRGSAAASWSRSSLAFLQAVLDTPSVAALRGSRRDGRSPRPPSSASLPRRP